LELRMKVRVKHVFKYTWDNETTQTLERGDYDVPRDLEQRTALLAIQFGAAVRINEKVAPENKVVTAPETKKRAKKAK